MITGSIVGGSGSSGNGIKGIINVPSDFPTPSKVKNLYTYLIGQNVVDNDPTRTNTGQSFTKGQIIVWDSGTSSWVASTDGADIQTLWGYQDFPAGTITGTSVTLTSNQNGTDAEFNPTNFYNYAEIYKADGTDWVYTAGFAGLFQGLVDVVSESGVSITLNKIPNPATNCRIWWLYQGFRPISGYIIPPENILNSASTIKLNELFQTKVNSPTNNNILTTDASGQSKDSGKSFSDTDTPTTNQIWSGSKSKSYADSKVENAINDGITDKAPSENAVYDALALKADKSTTINTSSPLTGGGDLSQNRTLGIQDASTTQKGATQLSNSYSGTSQVLAATEKALSDGLATKEPTIPTGTTTQYLRGDKTWQTLDTSVVPENGNLYFTTARVLATALTNLIAAASYSVLAPTDTILQAFGKIKKLLDTTNSFDRWVDAVVGSDSFTTNSKLIPFATINKALTSAQFPLKIHLLGQSFTENLTLTSGQSNITIGSEFTASGGVQTELNGTIATSSSFTRLRLMNLTLNAGSSIPITLASGDLGRHVFENVIIQTTNSSLMSIPTNFQNWIDLIGVDISGSAASILALPTLVGTTATLNIKKLKGVLNISAAANSGWTIYVDSDCVLNWVGGYNNTPVFYTGQPKIDVISVITTQASLTSLLASASGIGLYAINFTSPTGLTGLAQGDIIYHAGANSNAIFYPFALAPSAINVVAAGTYSKTSNGWELISNQLQIRQLIRTQTALDSVISNGTLGNFIVGFASPSHAQLSGLAIGDIIQVSGVNSTRILSTFANAPQVVFCNVAGTNNGAYIKTGDPIHRWKLESGVATFSNANYSIPNFSGLTLLQIGTMSAERIVSLPASSSTPTTNTTIKIIDTSGTVSATNRIRVNPAGADKINGVSAPIYINIPFGEVELVFNGTDGWVITDASLAVNIISYKAGSYTYTPDPNLIFATIKLVGGGGAGGTAPANNALNRSCSAGGGAGATIEAILFPANIGTSKAIVVGVGGNAAVTPVSATASTFGGTILVAGAGATGGISSGPVCATNSSIGGTFSTTLPASQIISQSNGGRGGNSFCNTTPFFFAGAGGISSMSGGAPSGLSNSDFAALDAVGYGGGGRGSVNDLNAPARIGGNGSDGIVIITEYVRA